jgi:hypothetical protein
MPYVTGVGEFSGVKNELDALETVVSANSTAIVEVLSTVDGVLSAMETLNPIVSANSTAIIDIQSAMATLEPIVSANTTAIIDIQSAMATLPPIVSANSTAIIDIQSALATLPPIVSANSTAIIDIKALLAAMAGHLTYIPAYDFGTETPTQEALTAYALTFHDPLINSLAVTNLSDHNEWIYNLDNNLWINNNDTAIQTATNASLGVVKGSTEQGKASVNLAGEIELNLADWAKAEDKPSYTAAEVGALDVAGTAQDAKVLKNQSGNTAAFFSNPDYDKQGVYYNYIDATEGIDTSVSLAPLINGVFHVLTFNQLLFFTQIAIVANCINERGTIYTRVIRNKTIDAQAAWKVYKKSINYSTAKTATGDIWIDGKPIYRRMFTGTITAAANAAVNTVLLNSSHISLVKVFGNWQYANQLNYTAMISGYESAGIVSNVRSGAALVLATASVNVRTNAPYNVVIEYTELTTAEINNG